MTAPSVAGNRRAAIMGAVGGGLLLVVLIGTRLMGGGGGSDSPSVTLPPSGLPTTSTTQPAASEPGDVETFEVFTTKNPFTPLSGAGAGAALGGGSAAGGSAAGGSTSGGTGGSGGATTATIAATGAGGSSEPTRSQRVALLDIFVESGQTVANVRVDDTVYKVAEGEAFATRYRVVSLSTAEGCGRFVFGDDQFRLCKGEEVLK